MLQVSSCQRLSGISPPAVLLLDKSFTIVKNDLFYNCLKHKLSYDRTFLF